MMAGIQIGKVDKAERGGELRRIYTPRLRLLQVGFNIDDTDETDNTLPLLLGLTVCTEQNETMECLQLTNLLLFADGRPEAVDYRLAGVVRY
jgi:hypothetical protein